MDDNGASRALKQAFQLWFEPEIKRRVAEGRIGKDFSVWAAQVVMNLDADPVVRINNEVRGAFVARAGKIGSKAKAGETIRLRDLSQIESVELTDEDPNAGHLTAIVHHRRWHVFFDFRYNAGRIESLLRAADEFLAAATTAAERGHAIATIDNLYDSVQLMAKSFLLTTPERAALESKTHGFIETRFNRQAKLGNVERASADLLNRLARLRPQTRYAFEPVRIAQSELQQMLESAGKMRADIETRRPRRAKGPTRHSV
jgi:uncharacterized protein (UPF0332 family)